MRGGSGFAVCGARSGFGVDAVPKSNHFIHEGVDGGADFSWHWHVVPDKKCADVLDLADRQLETICGLHRQRSVA